MSIMEAGPSEYRCTHLDCGKTFTRKVSALPGGPGLGQSQMAHIAAGSPRPAFGQPSVSLRPSTAHHADHPFPDLTPGFHCPTCKRPFKRLDLLQRHEKRGICGDEGPVKRRRTSESDDVSQPSHSVKLDDPPIVPPTDLDPDWGFGLWPPDPWGSLLHDTLAPPFNEPAMTVEMPWSGGANPLTPRMQESAERGGELVLNQGLVIRLQMAFPVSR